MKRGPISNDRNELSRMALFTLRIMGFPLRITPGAAISVFVMIGQNTTVALRLQCVHAELHVLHKGSCTNRVKASLELPIFNSRLTQKPRIT